MHTSVTSAFTGCAWLTADDIAHLLVREHVPHPIARHDEEEVIGLELSRRGVRRIREDWPLRVQLQLRIPEGARAAVIHARARATVNMRALKS